MRRRLRVGKGFLHVSSSGRSSHVFGLFGAVHMTAGHYALRGSGPGHYHAFDNALAQVGCPDRRIDRLCITCCLPSQPFTSRRMPDAISFTPLVRRVPCSARPSSSSPRPCERLGVVRRLLGPPPHGAGPPRQLQLVTGRTGWETLTWSEWRSKADRIFLLRPFGTREQRTFQSPD